MREIKEFIRGAAHGLSGRNRFESTTTPLTTLEFAAKQPRKWAILKNPALSLKQSLEQEPIAALVKSVVMGKFKL